MPTNMVRQNTESRYFSEYLVLDSLEQIGQSNGKIYLDIASCPKPPRTSRSKLWEVVFRYRILSNIACEHVYGYGQNVTALVYIITYREKI